jgi:hypothetical protein
MTTNTAEPNPEVMSANEMRLDDPRHIAYLQKKAEPKPEVPMNWESVQQAQWIACVRCTMPFKVFGSYVPILCDECSTKGSAR